MGEPPRRVGSDGHVVGQVDSRVEPDGKHRAGRVGLDDADTHRLRHVAGIVHFEHVGEPRFIDRHGVGFPGDVAWVSTGFQADDLPERVLLRSRLAVAHGSAWQAVAASQVGELGKPLPPAGIGGVDFFDQRLRFALADQRGLGLLGAKDEHLDFPLGQQLLFPLQPRGDRRRPAKPRGSPGRDDHVVGALLLGQHDLLPDGHRLPGRRGLLAGPRGMGAASGGQLHLNSQSRARLHGGEIRQEIELEDLAGREDQVFTQQPDSKVVVRPAVHHELVAQSVQLAGVDALKELGEGDGNPIRILGVVDRDQLDQELGVGQRRDDQIDGVVGARAALANHQMLRLDGR